MARPIVLPTFGALPASIKVHALHASVGDHLAGGSSLADFRVEFDPGGSYQCAPVSFFRLIIREPGWLTRLLVEVGSFPESYALIGALGETAADGDDTPDGQPVRTVSASILAPQDGWWTSPT